MHRNWHVSACICALLSYKTETKATELPDAVEALSNGLTLKGELSYSAPKGLKDAMGKVGGLIGETSKLNEASKEGQEALAVANVKLGTKLIITGLTGGGGVLGGIVIDAGVDLVVDHVYEGIQIQRQFREFTANHEANMAKIDARRNEWVAGWEQQLKAMPHNSDYQLSAIKLMGTGSFSTIDPDTYHERDRARARETLSKDPTCGTMEWYDTVGGTCMPKEQAEEPPPKKTSGWRSAQGGQCGFPDMEFEGIADILGKNAFGCQLAQRTKTNTEIKYVLNCGSFLAAAIAEKISDDQFSFSMGFEGGGSKKTMFVRCQ
ncbi:hypothetical protein QA648_36975 (plasmid) [Rhizobium sp. CB3171]|uniref:hypothetical protein n=1 Tax=Rhizobium sp. CB3171 TaxID=3039157 RepID=UPI0024B0846E|nr:hypothetical protein [Rhizobium sp. CB3171]WFU07533.1 hypothetical protein QA648_36975 [Rhizobium sp. CB3171]